MQRVVRLRQVRSSRGGWLIFEYLRELSGIAALIFLVTAVAIAWLRPSNHELGAASAAASRAPVYAIGFSGEPGTIWVNQFQMGAIDYDWSTGEFLTDWPMRSQSLCDIERGGRDFVTTVMADSIGRMYIVNDRRIHVNYQSVPPEQNIQDVDVSEDGKKVFAVRRGSELLEWVWNGTTFLQTTYTLNGSTESVRVSPDGGRLLIGIDATSVLVWDRAQRQEILRFQAHDRRMTQVSWSPDGTIVATGGDDGFIRLWQANSGDLIWEAMADSLGPASLAFSHDGRRVAAGGFDQLIRVWETDGGRLVTELEGHPGPIRALAFEPGGRVLASADLAGSVRIWSADDYRLLRELQ